MKKALLALIFVVVLVGCVQQKGIVEAHGEIKHLKLFCRADECKWLLALRVEIAEQIKTGYLELSIPIAGETILLDIDDSRANLWVKNDTGVETCKKSVCITSYELEDDMQSTTIVYKEVLGSSGLPEFSGTPK